MDIETELKWSDQIVRCCDCQSNFILSAGEQDFYTARGLTLPKRCPACRKRRKTTKEVRGGDNG